jgi:hypothetical protein
MDSEQLYLERFIAEHRSLEHSIQRPSLTEAARGNSNSGKLP